MSQHKTESHIHTDNVKKVFLEFLKSEIDSWEICKVFNTACVAFSNNEAGDYGEDFVEGYIAWLEENPKPERMKEDEYKRGYEMGRMFGFFANQRQMKNYNVDSILDAIKKNLK